MRFTEFITESSKICPQCGMRGCTCKPGTCKCKPKPGYPKNIDEAANPAQQAAIAIAKKKKQGVAEGASSIEQKIIKLYKQGLSDDEIASRLKIDSDDVKSVLDDYEWVADTTGEEKGVAEGSNPEKVEVRFSAKEYAAMSPAQKAAKQEEWQQLKQQAKMRLQNFTLIDTDKEQGVAEEGKGLWANIHAKQNRIKKGSGEHMRKPGSKGAPTAKNFKDAATESDEGMFGRSKNDKRYLDKFDPTEVMNISDDPGMKAHKTTGKGSLRTSKEDLEFAFGPPGEDDTWVLEFSNGLIATIYPQSNSAGMDWIIGGNHSNTEDFVHMAYSAAQDEKLEEDWQKVNKKDKTDGMSKKAVSAYRRENPGSKLKTAVTTKPSKLKKGSKSAKRRKSFCARMSGMKKAHASAKTKRDPDSPINKALRRWNCESVQQMEKLVMIAEQKIRNLKK